MWRQGVVPWCKSQRKSYGRGLFYSLYQLSVLLMPHWLLQGLDQIWTFRVGLSFPFFEPQFFLWRLSRYQNPLRAAHRKPVTALTHPLPFFRLFRQTNGQDIPPIGVVFLPDFVFVIYGVFWMRLNFFFFFVLCFFFFFFLSSFFFFLLLLSWVRTGFWA